MQGLAMRPVQRALPVQRAIGQGRCSTSLQRSQHRAPVKAHASLAASGDKQWLKLLVDKLSDAELAELGLCRLGSAPATPILALPSPPHSESLSLSLRSSTDSAILAIAVPSVVIDSPADAVFVEDITISTLLVSEPEQRYFFTRLREGRLRALLNETGSVGVIASPSASAVLDTAAALEPGQVYYLKPKISRGLEPAKDDLERTLANAPRVLASLAAAKANAAAAALLSPEEAAAASAREREEDAHDEALWLNPTDAVLARARCDFPDAKALGSAFSVAGVKGEPPVSVDCAVVSDGVAWIIVSGGTLTEQSGESVLEAVSNIAYWRDRDACPDELRAFRGKRLVPVLCGKAIRPERSQQTKVTPDILAECWAALGVALIVPRSVSRRLGEGFQKKAAALFSRAAA